MTSRIAQLLLLLAWLVAVGCTPAQLPSDDEGLSSGTSGGQISRIPESSPTTTVGTESPSGPVETLSSEPPPVKPIDFLENSGPNSEPIVPDPSPEQKEVKLKWNGRVARLYLPSNYKASKSPWPLVVLMHGYSAGGVLQDLYLGLSRRVDELGVAVLIAEGKRDLVGLAYFNATDYCCDTFNSGVDDVSYINAVVDLALGQYRLDARKVYLFGHSNGGFMAYRLACENPEKYAGLLALAGTTHKDESDCVARQPITVVHVHGTWDTLILYGGTPWYPGAEETVNRFRERNGCDQTPEWTDDADLEGVLPGSETEITTWSCEQGTSVSRWKIKNGSHLPMFNKQFLKRALSFLLGHQRAAP